MEITTPNLDPTYTDPTTGRPVANSGFENNLSQVRFESTVYDTREPIKKPSLFSRILSGFGKIVAPLSFLAAPFTGGMSLIAGAGAQGLGAMADKSIAIDQQKKMAAAAAQPPVSLNYPGMMSGTLASDPTLSLVTSSRDASVNQAIHGY
ncbi:MAG TPA: hypothetical protein VFX30_00870 [bacterium]|nr:hypothetical protein [bacterium]